MCDQIFERSDALRRQLAGLLREERLAYLLQRAEQGAPRSTLRKLAQYLLVVTERLNLRHHGTVTTAQIERAGDQWARRQVQHHKIKGGFSRKSKSCFVCVATNWVRFLGRLQSPETRPHRFAQLVVSFARYLEEEKGLAPTEMRHSLPHHPGRTYNDSWQTPIGHHKVDSTRIYTKVDLPHLRQVADVDLGGLR